MPGRIDATDHRIKKLKGNEETRKSHFLKTTLRSSVGIMVSRNTMNSRLALERADLAAGVVCAVGSRRARPYGVASIVGKDHPLYRRDALAHKDVHSHGSYLI